jgi:hypothetical protein
VLLYQEIPHWRFAQTTTGGAAISLPGAISKVVRQYVAGSHRCHSDDLEVLINVISGFSLA